MRRAFRQKQLTEARQIRRLPLLPPLRELIALPRQAPSMRANQRLDSGLQLFPFLRPHLSIAIAKRSQSLARHMTVIRQAENLLHLLDARINHLAHLMRETARENLDGITKLFSQNAHLMQMFVVIEVSHGSPA